MPLHIDINVNSTLLSQLHIGRFTGTSNPDSNNLYLVVQGDRPTDLNDWAARGIKFYHVYGDGANVCLLKALQALEAKKQDTISHPPHTFRDIGNGE
jgi:hypothetical protein